MTWLVGHWPNLAEVAARAVLIYLAALLALRVASRRTLAQWTAIDFAAAVAVGSIMGRTALAGDQTFLMGAVALLVIIAAHWLASVARFHPLLAKLADHRVRLLVVNGELRRGQLRLCALTENDVAAQLREKGFHDYSGLRYVLYETKGGLTVVPESGQEDGGLVRLALEHATGHPLADQAKED
jgi:uncharacterized membrane protein YcaP (DUF421 family)